METESLDGKLKRASLKFDIAEMKSNVTAGMAFAMSAAVFGDKVAGINLLQDKEAGKKLGLSNAYDPRPDEIENNGVILRRYTKGGKLFL